MDNETKDAPAYEAPKIVDYGSLRELTTATNAGTFVDHTLQTGDSILNSLSTASHGIPG